MNKKITIQKWSGIAFKVKNKLRQSLELWRSLTNYFILIRRSRIGFSVRKSLGLFGQSLTNEPTLKLTHFQTLKLTHNYFINPLFFNNGLILGVLPVKSLNA